MEGNEEDFASHMVDLMFNNERLERLSNFFVSCSPLQIDVLNQQNSSYKAAP
jgi:hypothetical protein